MFKVFGLPIDDLSIDEVVHQILGFCNSNSPHLIVTANPEILLQAYQDQDYWKLLAGADLRLADGIGVVLLSYLFSKPLLHGRITGVDLVQKLVKLATNTPLSIFLVGGSFEVLQKATQNLSKYYAKNLKLYYGVGPQFSSKDTFPIKDITNNLLLKQINIVKPTILLVGFGAPKQEKWLNYYLPLLPSVKVGIGVGGVFDYLSKTVIRAPIIIRFVGLEWLWRLVRQPWRWKRIFKAVVVFPALVIKDFLHQKLFHVEQ